MCWQFPKISYNTTLSYRPFLGVNSNYKVVKFEKNYSENQQIYFANTA